MYVYQLFLFFWYFVKYSGIWYLIWPVCFSIQTKYRNVGCSGVFRIILKNYILMFNRVLNTLGNIAVWKMSVFGVFLSVFSRIPIEYRELCWPEKSCISAYLTEFMCILCSFFNKNFKIINAFSLSTRLKPVP